MKLTIVELEALDGITEEWRNSAVTEEYQRFITNKGCLKLFTRDEAKAELMLNKLRIDSPMVWGVRGIDPSGEDSVCTLQIKVGGTPKYRSPKDGGSDAICLPPLRYESWEEALKSTKRLWLTEGVKKAACLMSLGELAVSVTGVQCCLPEDSKGNRRPSLHWVLSKCAEYGVEIFICFDMDVYTKLDVRKALIKLTRYLKEQSISYRVIEWNSNKNRKGIDDYLAFFDTEDERMDELDELIASPMKAEIIAKWEEGLKPKPSKTESDKPSGKLTSYQKAEKAVELLAGNYRYHYEQKVLRGYNGKYWEPIELIPAQNLVEEAIRDTPPVSNKESKDILAIVERKLLDTHWNSLEKKGYFVSFNNGVLNTKTKQFKPHRSEFLLTGCSEFDFTRLPDEPTLTLMKEHTPTIYQWAVERFASEIEVEAYVAVIHATLTGLTAKLQKFFLFEGRSGTGKGTAARLVEAIIGKEKETAKLNQLTDAEVISRIAQTRLAVFPDEETVSVGLDVLASLTGNDPISARKLFVGSYSTKFNGTIIVCANQYPFVGKHADKIKRRVRAFKMDNVIKGRDYKIEERLYPELPLLASIACLMDTQRATDLINGQSGDKVSSVLLDWEYSCQESVPRFINEYCYYNPDEYAAITSGINSNDAETEGGFLSLYDAYKSFCRAGNFQLFNEVNFGKALRHTADFLEREVGWRIEGTGERKVKKTVKGQRRNCITGLVLCDFNDGQTLADQIRDAIEESVRVKVGCQGEKAECQGECQGAKPLSDIECQGSQGKNPLNVEVNELSLLFEGEVIDLGESTQVYPDTSDNLSPVSDSDPDSDPDSDKSDPTNPDTCWVWDTRSNEWRWAKDFGYHNGKHRCQMSGEPVREFASLLIARKAEKPSKAPRGLHRLSDS
jgi:phage/plasmid-associated DNA primase